MSTSRIRGFLLQLPKPALVRVSKDDGEPQELKPGKSYAKLAETIEALGPDLIECLDSKGAVLRAKRLDTDESRRSDAAELPAVLSTDPHAALLTHFANLLHRAYEHSSEIAFTRLVEIVDKMGDRSDSIEQRLERSEADRRRMLQDQVDSEYERAAEQAAAAAANEGGFEQQLVGSFINGAMNGRGAKPAPAKG